MYYPGRKKQAGEIVSTGSTFSSIPLVLEFGGLTTRAGFAGYETPNVQIPSSLAVKDSTLKLMEFGNPRGLVDAEVTSFLSQGAVTDWETATAQVAAINKEILGVDAKETPLFLVEPALVGKEARVKCVEAVFEQMNFASLFIHKAPVLSSYVLAKETILLIDMGGNSTYVVPIIGGYIAQKGVVRSGVAGEYLTEQLAQIWQKKASESALNRFSNASELKASMSQWGKMEMVREAKSRNLKLKENRYTTTKFNTAVDTQIFELPDKSKLELLTEMYDVPEMLFNPIPEENFMGLQELVKQSLERVDAENRRELLMNIMVIGGNSLIQNLIERLQREISGLELSSQARVKIYTAATLNERTHSSWVGGSIVASMPNFENLLMTKADYEEHGAVLIDRKVLF